MRTGVTIVPSGARRWSSRWWKNSQRVSPTAELPALVQVPMVAVSLKTAFLICSVSDVASGAWSRRT
jgi:hypothetical protein